MSGEHELEYRRQSEAAEAARRQAEEAARLAKKEEERQIALAKKRRAEEREKLCERYEMLSKRFSGIRTTYAQSIDEAMASRVAGRLEEARHRLTVADVNDAALREIRRDIDWADKMLNTLTEQAEGRMLRDLQTQRDHLTARIAAYPDGAFDPEGRIAVETQLHELMVVQSLPEITLAIDATEAVFLQHADRAAGARATQRAQVEAMNGERASLLATAETHGRLPRALLDALNRLSSQVSQALLAPSFPAAEALLERMRAELSREVDAATKGQAVAEDVKRAVGKALMEEFGVVPTPVSDGLRLVLEGGRTVEVKTSIEDGRPRISSLFEGFPLIETDGVGTCGVIEDRMASLLDRALAEAGFAPTANPSWKRKQAPRRKFSFSTSPEEENSARRTHQSVRS